MKNKKLTWLFIVIMLICLVGCIIAYLVITDSANKGTQAVTASTEQTVPPTAEEDKPTDMATWFEEEAMPYVMTFATTLSGLLIVLTPFVVTLKNLKGNAKRMVELNSNVVADNTILKLQNKTLRAQIKDTNDTVHKLLEMSKIAYLNNHDLVANGYAVQIADVCSCKELDEEVAEDEQEIKKADESKSKG